MTEMKPHRKQRAEWKVSVACQERPKCFKLYKEKITCQVSIIRSNYKFQNNIDLPKELSGFANVNEIHGF